MKTHCGNTSFQEEFKVLFEEYYGPFCIYTKRIIKDEEASKDIVSEVYATFWHERDRVELKKETVLAYIKTCVRNKAFNYLKHKKHQWSHIEYVMSKPAVYTETPDKLYNQNELYELLQQSLDRLPEEYKEIFIQSIIKKRSHEEIAKRLNISLRSVNRYKQKVLGQLRLDLKDYLPAAIVATILASTN